MDSKRKTSKPCPGCGRAESWPFREVDAVCGTCKDQLESFRKIRDEAQKAAESDKGKSTNIRMAGFYEGKICQFASWRDSATEAPGNGYVLREAFLRLLRACLPPDHELTQGEIPSIPRPLPSCVPESRSRVDARALTTRKQRDAITAFDHQLRFAMIRAYREGFAAGSNVIARLASGQAGADDFDKEADPSRPYTPLARFVCGDGRVLWLVYDAGHFFVDNLDKDYVSARYCTIEVGTRRYPCEWTEEEEGGKHIPKRLKGKLDRKFIASESLFPSP